MGNAYEAALSAAVSPNLQLCHATPLRSYDGVAYVVVVDSQFYLVIISLLHSFVSSFKDCQELGRCGIPYFFLDLFVLRTCTLCKGGVMIR